MLNKFFRTEDDSALLVARLALGIVFLPHGLQKTLGLFGGAGFSGTMGFFTQQGLPSIIAFLVIIAESFGALGLIIGFLSRLAAFGICLNMLGAILMVHLPNGFFMNWFGTQKGEGFEYHILAIGLALVVLIGGGGKWSVDRLLLKD
ncbi:MAG TPA: DoxX family protein [Thermodesulfobacteriota bacterium]